MPVIKVKKNGEWKNIVGTISGTSPIVNADTLDYKHASDFASVNDMEVLQNDVSELQTLTGTTPVSEQINTAISNIPTEKTLTEHLAEESMILTSLHYGDNFPTTDLVPGMLFFKKVAD